MSYYTSNYYSSNNYSSNYYRADVEADAVLAGGFGFEPVSAELMRKRDDEDIMTIINAFLFMKDQEN